MAAAKPTLELDEPTVVRSEHIEAHEILSNLYLSPGFVATDESKLRSDGITHVLNCAIELETQQFTSIQVLHLKLYDSPEQELPFARAESFISECIETGGKCLVHCNAGQSRSASLIIYYLLNKGISLNQALAYVKARKPNIRPNFGFASQLEKAENDLHGKSTFDMSEFKAEGLMEILEGSTKTKLDALEALRRTNGDAVLALNLLLE